MGNAAEKLGLSGKAYMILRNRILRGQLPLGTTISRRKTAAELSMSLLPVMEALERLEYEGLVESRPRAGTRVRIPSREDVLGQFIVREALECQAAKLFSEKATPKEREALLRLGMRVDSAWEEDKVRFAVLHERFHRQVARSSHCPALERAIEVTQALSFTWLTTVVPRMPVHSLGFRDHQKLAQTFIDRPPEECVEKMREHVMLGLRQVMDGLQPYFELHRRVRKKYRRSGREETIPLQPASPAV